MKKSLLPFVMGTTLLLFPLSVSAQTNGPIGQITSYQGQLMGSSAGVAGTNAIYNVFVGRKAGSSSTGHQNVFDGDEAGALFITGNNNTAIGDSASSTATTGSWNTSIGTAAGAYWKTGSNNIAINNYGTSTDTDNATTCIGES